VENGEFRGDGKGRYTQSELLLTRWMNTTAELWSLGTTVPGREGFRNWPLQALDCSDLGCQLKPCWFFHFLGSLICFRKRTRPMESSCTKAGNQALLPSGLRSLYPCVMCCWSGAESLFRAHIDWHPDQLHQIFATDNIQYKMCVMFHNSVLQIRQVTVLSNILTIVYAHANNGLINACITMDFLMFQLSSTSPVPYKAPHSSIRGQAQTPVIHMEFQTPVLPVSRPVHYQLPLPPFHAPIPVLHCYVLPLSFRPVDNPRQISS
jgi:hypothetical protein